MEPEGKQSFAMATSLVVKMRANMADAPYTFQKGALTNWRFSLAYAQLSAFMPLAHQYLAASRLPYAEREEALHVGILTCTSWSAPKPRVPLAYAIILEVIVSVAATFRSIHSA